MFFIKMGSDTFVSNALLSVKLVPDDVHKGQSMVRLSFSDITNAEGFHVLNVRSGNPTALYETLLQELADTEALTVGTIINEAPNKWGMFSQTEITRPTGRGLIVDISEIIDRANGTKEKAS